MHPGGLFLSLFFLTAGALLLLTAHEPHRNRLTRTLFWLTSVMPRTSFTDRGWVLATGIAFLLVGVGLALAALDLF